MLKPRRKRRNNVRHLKILAAVLVVAITLTLTGAFVITEVRDQGAALTRRVAESAFQEWGTPGGDNLGTKSGLPPLILGLAHDIDHSH